MTDLESRYLNRIADTERKQAERWCAKHPPLDALTGMRPVARDVRNPWHELPEERIRERTAAYLHAHGMHSKLEIDFFAKMFSDGRGLRTALKELDANKNTRTKYEKDFKKLFSDLGISGGRLS